MSPGGKGATPTDTVGNGGNGYTLAAATPAASRFAALKPWKKAAE